MQKNDGGTLQKRMDNRDSDQEILMITLKIAWLAPLLFWTSTVVDSGACSLRT